MAVRFYRELINLSAADFYAKSNKKAGRDYEVERVIARRTRKRKAEYLVKWRSYSALCNSWEPEENLNSLALRTFWKPNPIPELVTSGIEALHVGILENLASKSMLATINPFRHDVFRFLFNKKGTTSDDGKYIFLEKRDFSKCAWPSDWDQVVDRLGDGVKPDYPIKMRLFVSQSPRNHTLVDGQIKQSPYYYTEKLSVNCRKEPFTLTNLQCDCVSCLHGSKQVKLL